MKKLLAFVFCAVVAVAFVVKSHLHAAMANSQPVATRTVVAQPANENVSQENVLRQKIKEANKVIVPANSARSTTPELTLEQAKALEGTITNQYGIRDDIYEYIMDTIPKDNASAVKSAIKLAQYDNRIYYHSTNKEEALELAKKQNLAAACLQISLSGKTWLVVFDQIDKMMRNTTARNKRMWDIDEKYFGWEALGTGLTTSEE